MSFSAYFSFAYIDALPKKIIGISLVYFLLFLILRFTKIKNSFQALSKVNPIKILILIVFLGLCLRLLWASQNPTHFPNNYDDQSVELTESSLISIYAHEIAKSGVPLNKEGLLDTRRPMGYPYLLGGIVKFISTKTHSFIFFQILLDILLIIIFYFLTKEIFSNPHIALIASFLLSIYPSNWSSVNIILDEYPFFVFFFLALIFIVRNINSQNCNKPILIGLLIGLATFFRTVALLLPLVCFAIYFIRKVPLKRNLIHILIVFIMIYTINAPWAVITYKAYKVPCFFTTANMYFHSTLNNKAEWNNGYLPVSVDDGGDEIFLNEKNPVLRAQRGVKLAKNWVFENPAKTVQWFFMRNLALMGFDLRDELLDLNITHAESKNNLIFSVESQLRKLKAWFYAFICLSLLLFFCLKLKKIAKYLNSIFPGTLIFFGISLYWLGIHGFFFGFRKYRWTLEIMYLIPLAYVIYSYYRNLIIHQNAMDTKLQKLRTSD